ncbi:GTP 3',8-cyclase MoaA [Natranaerobius trueperi]|uniref:GTP 3',8-cyclase n=1 Tax=Natranaerobius trueperi TaxID=759412 RepID=A0A226BZH0_9FIRM|nr:GTP 3',8-cyclase MoaA [Natranaerobius trueperi]OWZ83589.1 GTP 3',8-cyclase MoaA [Natranaerobius trueperi]
MYLDNHGRKIDYMRISVTDRCNLRCFYCMPHQGISKVSYTSIMKYEDIRKVIEAAVQLGITKFRFTGGEPLVRKDFHKLIELVNHFDNIQDISLTTNGILLKNQAAKLKEAGVNRLNVSLDTLNEEKFNNITRGGNLSDVLYGIEEATNQGLTPIKINVVVIRGTNDDEILDFARMSIKQDVEIRFIEYMPIGNNDNWKSRFIGVDSIKQICEKLGKLIPAETVKGEGPASYYRFKNSNGKLGFISPVSDHFCSDCNRIRLTSDGKLKTCLFSDEELDLKPALKSQEDLMKVLNKAIKMKPEKHNISSDKSWTFGNEYRSKRNMSQIGG